MISLVAYLLLFLAVGVGFIFIHLVIGKLIRPSKPYAEKRTIYECGEPTIGSAWVQFDVRYYVVALLFVIFDVEVAFFFPWAVVFGQANALADTTQPVGQQVERYLALTPDYPRNRRAREEVKDLFQRSQDANARPEVREKAARDLQIKLTQARGPAKQLAWVALFDILVFFGVLLVGFAYLWKRGDLAWVRSTAAERLADRNFARGAAAGRELVGAGPG
jgi:NADH-quinone oxidoreductase subunit A